MTTSILFFSVPAFKASKYLITNREYLEFVKDGGYKNSKYWTKEGKNSCVSRAEGGERVVYTDAILRVKLLISLLHIPRCIVHRNRITFNVLMRGDALLRH